MKINWYRNFSEIAQQHIWNGRRKNQWTRRQIGIIQSEEKEKRIRKINKTWHSEEPEGKKRTNWAERITEEIRVKFFPNLILKY